MTEQKLTPQKRKTAYDDYEEDDDCYISTDTDYYIAATEGAIVRLHKNTPGNIKGLYTGGLQCCMAIIVCNKRDQRISLTHKTIAMDEIALMRDEIFWATTGKYVLNVNQSKADQVDPRLWNSFLKNISKCEILIFTNHNYQDSHEEKAWKRDLETHKKQMHQFRDYVKQQYGLTFSAIREAPGGWVLIDRNFKIRTQGLTPIRVPHSKESLHRDIARVNSYFHSMTPQTYKFRMGEPEFDGNTWSSFPPAGICYHGHDITDYFRSKIQGGGTLDGDDLDCIDQVKRISDSTYCAQLYRSVPAYKKFTDFFSLHPGLKRPIGMLVPFLEEKSERKNSEASQVQKNDTVLIKPPT